MVTETFNATGSKQTYTVPSGVHLLEARLWGAGASDSNGGYVEGRFFVSPGDTLNIYVGEENNGSNGGWPSGGNGGTETNNSGGSDANGRGGAGYTAILPSSDVFTDAIAIAGGSGGRGQAGAVNSATSAGGDGGSNTAEDAGDLGPSFDGTQADGGHGGDQSSGGAAGSPGSPSGGGQPGGGTGGTAAFLDSAGAGGGGGGAGWHGGGGGGADINENEARGAGGGGGANYVGGLDDIILNQRGAGNNGDGQIELFYPAVNVYHNGSFIERPIQYYDGSEWASGITNVYESGSWQPVS